MPTKRISWVDGGGGARSLTLHPAGGSLYILAGYRNSSERFSMPTVRAGLRSLADAMMLCLAGGTATRVNVGRIDRSSIYVRRATGAHSTSIVLHPDASYGLDLMVTDRAARTFIRYIDSMYAPMRTAITDQQIGVDHEPETNPSTSPRPSRDATMSEQLSSYGDIPYGNPFVPGDSQ